MNWLHAIILGIVEGITEFLPVSSTGHLRIVEKLLGYDIQGAGITAFTAICLLYTSPSPRDGLLSRMPSSA